MTPGIVAIVFDIFGQAIAPVVAAQTDSGQVDWLQMLYHLMATGLSAGAIYKLTDWIAYGFWLFRNEALPGRVKAGLAFVLSLIVPSLIYVIVLVDGGLVRYDYRGLVAVVCSSFMLSWAVYQQSKYKGRAGASVQKGKGKAKKSAARRKAPVAAQPPRAEAETRPL